MRAYALLTLAQSAGLPQAQSALAQMDQFVPIEQRQQAQLLAREIETEAGNRRAAELAAVDLGQRVPVTVPAALPVPQPVAAPVSTITAARPVTAAAPPTAPVRSSPAARAGNWKVQLGAFGVRANADRLWSKLAGTSALAGTTKVLATSGNVTRLQAKGFNSRAEAQAACDALSRQGHSCMVTAP